MGNLESGRPQNNYGAFDAEVPGGGSVGNLRYERSEIQTSRVPIVETRFSEDRPVDIVHLYTERQQDGSFKWWTERQPVEDWLNEVQEGQREGNKHYGGLPVDQAPSVITHIRPSIPEEVIKLYPAYANREWITLRYSVLQSQGTYAYRVIQILNSTPLPRYAEYPFEWQEEVNPKWIERRIDNWDENIKDQEVTTILDHEQLTDTVQLMNEWKSQNNG